MNSPAESRHEEYLWMSLTTDPNDLRLGHGSDSEPGPQNEVYLVLPEAETAKGFVRPFRATYVHVGIRPTYTTRPLSSGELKTYTAVKYVAYEPYPLGDGTLGRFWTAEQLTSGCGATTTMGVQLAATYAREPRFYGATYCVRCARHRPVEEFVWDDGSGQRVGA